MRSVGVLRRVGVVVGVTGSNRAKAAPSASAQSRLNSGVGWAGGTGIEPATCGFGVRFLRSIVAHLGAPVP